RLVPELLDVDAALLIDRRVPVEPRGDTGRKGSRRPQIAGDLVDHEPVEWHVVIEGRDDPVAVLPDRARGIDAVSVGVRIPGRAQRWRKWGDAIRRSTARSYRPGDGSATNRVTSSGDGGRPTRSRFARRSKIVGSASGDGERPPISSRAATKRSMAFRTQLFP